MDMYLVRFDKRRRDLGRGAHRLNLTQLPAYDTTATATINVVYIWWYAHNGRIAFDGANYGAYFGAAIQHDPGVRAAEHPDHRHQHPPG